MIQIPKAATLLTALLCSILPDAVAEQTPSQAPSELILWPHRKNSILHVAYDTAQPFYLMGYARGEKLPHATEIQISAPPGWSVWAGENPPPEVNAEEGTRLVIPAPTKAQAEYLKGNVPSKASASSLLVVRAAEGAKAGTLKLRWIAGDQTIATSDIALVPLALSPATKMSESDTPLFGMWMNDPRFHPQTMNAVYQGLARAGVDYLILTKELYKRDKEALKAAGIKAYVKQWWKYDGYLPTPPPADAVSVLRDGSVERSRWSPTYMAERGPAFVEGVKGVISELQALEGIYGFMLDYEPTVKGIEADYSDHSKRAFEKYLGKAVVDWPQAVFEKGPLCDEWIEFRVGQSNAYVREFRDAMKEQLPHLKLAVSTSGITGTKADPNRRLAVVDISQLSEITDTVHPQLYSWTAELPKQVERYMDKARVGKTTAQASKNGVYTAIGAGVGGIDLPDPALLRTQVLYWWLSGGEGFEVWQYFYGVDGRYLQILQDVTKTIRAAGPWPRPHVRTTAASAVRISPAVGIEALLRPVADSSNVVVGFFNFSNMEKTFSLEALEGWKLEGAENTKTVAPWSVELVTVAQIK